MTEVWKKGFPDAKRIRGVLYNTVSIVRIWSAIEKIDRKYLILISDTRTFENFDVMPRR